MAKPTFNDLELEFLSDADALKRRAIPGWISWTQYVLATVMVAAGAVW